MSWSPTRSRPHSHPDCEPAETGCATSSSIPKSRRCSCTASGRPAHSSQGFRQSVGTDIDDPRFIELVGELSLASPLFRQLWARHDVAPRSGAAVTFAHPQVGTIHLDREKLAISGSDGLMLVAYHAQPGTESAEKLRILGSISLPTTQPSHRSTQNREQR